MSKLDSTVFPFIANLHRPVANDKGRGNPALSLHVRTTYDYFATSGKNNFHDPAE